MKKSFVSILAIMAICLLAVNSASYAGKVTVGTFTVSGEASGGTAVLAGVPVGAVITGYTPSDIPLNSLSDPVFNLTMSNTAALIAVVDTTISFCSSVSTNSIANLIATYSTGTASAALVFQPIGSPSISNGVAYILGVNAGAVRCAVVAPATALTLTVPNGTTTLSTTVTVGTAATQVVHDTGTVTFLTVKDEFSAAVSILANNEINYETNFVDLFGFVTEPEAKTTDVIVVKLTHAATSFTTNQSTTADNETLSCVLTPSDVSAITGVNITTATASGTLIGAATGAGLANACTVDSATTPTNWTCTWNTIDYVATTDFAMEVVVDGTTTVPELTFATVCGLDFAGVSTVVADKTVASGTPVIAADTSAGAWDYRGTSVYVPLVRNNDDATLETYFKFQSRDTATAANQIRGIVLCDGSGTSTTEVVDVGTITAGTPLAWTGTDMEALLTSDCTVDSSKGYAAILNITSSAADLFGLVTIVTPDGAQRRIPLSTDQATTMTGTFTGTAGATYTITSTGSSMGSGVSN